MILKIIWPELKLPQLETNHSHDLQLHPRTPPQSVNTLPFIWRTATRLLCPSRSVSHADRYVIRRKSRASRIHTSAGNAVISLRVRGFFFSFPVTLTTRSRSDGLYQTTRRHNPQDHNINLQGLTHLQSHIPFCRCVATSTHNYSYNK
jgi:hypothetical protein